MKQRENQQLREETSRQIHRLKTSLRDKDDTIAAKDAEASKHIQKLQVDFQDKEDVISMKESENQKLEATLRDKIDVLAARDKEIKHLREQLQPSSVQLHRISPLDIKLGWKMGKPAPIIMSRWSNAVAGVSVVYFNVGGCKVMYAYDVFSETWSLLPDCHSTTPLLRP